MQQMIYGAIIMGYAVAALFFLRFWQQTHDRLFAYFAGSFAILALQRIGLTALRASSGGEDGMLWYVLRLAAFVLLLVGILDKNRRPAAAGDGRD
jgi:hypothetical protein